MFFDDTEANWKNSEIATNFIDIYEAQKAALEKEAADLEAAEQRELAEDEAAIEAAAQRRYLENYHRVKAEVELTEMKKVMSKMASDAALNGNHKAALMIESAISDLGLPEVQDA